MGEFHAVIDIETGGFNRKRNGIVEIAFVVFKGEEMIDEISEVIERYNQLENPEIPCVYDDKATSVHGITTEIQKESGVPLSNVIHQIIEMKNEYGINVIVGQNHKSFDIPFLNYSCRLLNLEVIDKGCKLKDTLEMAKEKLILPNYKLGTIFSELFPKEKEIMNGAHRAGVDVIMTNKVYLKLK